MILWAVLILSVHAHSTLDSYIVIQISDRMIPSQLLSVHCLLRTYSQHTLAISVTQYTFFTIDCIHWPMNVVMLTSFCFEKLNHHHLPGPVRWSHHHLVCYLLSCADFVWSFYGPSWTYCFTQVSATVLPSQACSCTMYTAAALPWTGLSFTCPSLYIYIYMSVCMRTCIQKQFGKLNFCLFLCPALYTVCSSCNNSRWNKVNAKTV